MLLGHTLMCYFLLVWVLLTLASFILGLGLLSFFRVKDLKRSSDRFVTAVWLGLVVFANSFLAIALVAPLSPSIGALVIGGVVLLMLRFAHIRTEVVHILSKVSGCWIFWGGTLAIASALLTSQQVTWFDTGLYHFGSIRWIADYGAVPGVALLNHGFAFTSSWFALAAPFNPSFLGSRVSAALNGYLLFLTVLHAAIGGRHIFRQAAKRHDWFIVIYAFLTLPLFIFTPFLSAVLISPSPDMPVIMVTGAVAWAILVIADYQRVGSDSFLYHQDTLNAPSALSRTISNSWMVPLILGIGAVTFKLNGLPVLGISGLLYGVYHWRNPLRLGLGAGIILLLLTPMAAFGIITSGCPLYPSSLMCMPMPWALTSQQAADALARINGWNAWFGAPPAETNYWMWVLGKWLQLAHLNKVMVLLAIFSVLIAIWMLRKVNIRKASGEIWIVLLSLLGMGFIFSQAPLIRFGLGYFVLLPTLIGATLCDKHGQSLHLNKLLAHRTGKLLKSAILLVLFFVSALFTSLSGMKWQLVFPPELPKVAVVAKQINDFRYLSPQNSNKCWGTDLPCAPSELSEDIWLRNPSQGIAGGFRRQ